MGSPSTTAVLSRRQRVVVTPDSTVFAYCVEGISVSRNQPVKFVGERIKLAIAVLIVPFVSGKSVYAAVLAAPMVRMPCQAELMLPTFFFFLLFLVWRRFIYIYIFKLHTVLAAF